MSLNLAELAVRSMGIGFYGIPGQLGGMVHVTVDRRPICGQALDPRAEYQFCASCLYLDYVECQKCRRAVSKLYGKRTSKNVAARAK